MDKKALLEFYDKNADRYRLAAGKEKRILLWLSLLRLIIFLGGIIVSWICFTISVPLGIIILLFFSTLFIVLLRMFSVHTGQKDHCENLVSINSREASALSGDYSSFGDGSAFMDQLHDFSYDADIFGKASLFQYLNRTATGYGCGLLAGWLSDPFPLSGDLITRQETIKEIAGKPEWRQEFLATGMNKNLDREHITGLVCWLNDDTLLKENLFRLLLIWLLPSVNIISLCLVITGILPYPVFVLFFLLTLLITVLNLKNTVSVHNELTGRYRFLSSVGDLLLLFQKEQFKSRELIKIQSILKDSAVFSLKKLGRIIQALDSRLNIMVGFVLNGLLLWDMHCVHRLNRWKTRYRDQFPEWLTMLGSIDAYISLGNYAFNNEEFVFPVISKDGIILTAKKFGHPLIQEEKRVCNDFVLPAKGSICIISGANMAGKSTFLRTVAVNYILAMTGAPVCAGIMEFVPVKLFTSMRTTDSLSTNESYFYAELRRLKTLQSRLVEGDNILFILDEILKGTNSEDKSSGSKLFLRKLIGLSGTGLVATHDTTLGTLQEEFPEVINNKCIEIEIDGETIHFDYLLRDGITTSRNAVLLMKQMGILD